MKLSWALASIVLLHSTSSVFSQQSSSSSSDDDHLRPRISLIAVGDPPAPQYDIIGSKRVLKSVGESEYPPSLLYIKNKKKEFKEVSLGLNSPARPLRHPGGAKLAFYEGKNDEMESFINVPIPNVAEDLSIFLLRSHATKSWRKKPSSFVFKNGLLSFPKNSVRVINFSRLPAKVLVGKKLINLKARGSRTVSLAPAEQGILPFKIGVMVRDKTSMIAETALTYSKNARLNIVIYEADGHDKRKPVKYMTYFELPYQAPVKPKKNS